MLLNIESQCGMVKGQSSLFKVKGNQLLSTDANFQINKLTVTRMNNSNIQYMCNKYKINMFIRWKIFCYSLKKTGYQLIEINKLMITTIMKINYRSICIMSEKMCVNFTGLYPQAVTHKYNIGRCTLIGPSTAGLSFWVGRPPSPLGRVASHQQGWPSVVTSVGCMVVVGGGAASVQRRTYPWLSLEQTSQRCGPRASSR